MLDTLDKCPGCPRCPLHTDILDKPDICPVNPRQNRTDRTYTPSIGVYVRPFGPQGEEDHWTSFATSQIS